MANVKISQLPTATTLTTADLLPIVQGGVTKQVTPDLLPVSTPAATALAAKAPLASPAFTGTVTGVTAAMVGLGNVNNTSDAAKPVSTAQATALAAKADLVGGLVPSSQIPAIALTNAVTVANQAAMLALTTTQVQPGDVAVRTDGAGTFILTASDPTQLANWVRLNAPTDAVTTVNGQTGTVVLAAADVGAAPASLSTTVGTNTTNIATNTTAIAALTLGGTVNAITGNATAVIGVRNTVDATAAPVTVALPNATKVGQWLIIERLDASAVNAITITGTIRGVGSSSAVLPAVGVANEGGLWVAETLTSWTPAGSIKPKAWLDAAYDAKGAATTAVANLTAITDNGDGTFGVTGPAVTDNGDGTFTFTSGTVETAYTKTRTDALLTAAQGGIVGINGQTASYTTVLADAGKLVTVSSTSATTVTIPLNATVAYPVGTVLSFANLNTGAVTIAATSGATLSSPAGARITTQYAQASAVKIGTDTWLLSGQTVV